MTQDLLPLEDSKNDRSARLPVCLLIVIVAATFFPLCGFGFTSWDDQTFIVENPRLAHPSFENALHYWFNSYYTIYIPLTTSVWMLLSWASQTVSPDPAIGLNPFWFHTANVLVHIASTLAAFAVARRLLRSTWPAFAAAMVVGLHPVQVESVGWVSGLKDVLAGGLTFAAIAVYIDVVRNANGTPRFVRAGLIPTSPDPNSPWHWRNRSMDGDELVPIEPAFPAVRYAIATALFVLAMLAKPSAMLTGLIVLVIDAAVLRKKPGRAFILALPWLILGAAFALIARYLQPPATNLPSVALLQRPLIASQSIAFYLMKIAWPANLSIDYGQNPSAVLAGSWVYWAWIVPAIAIVIAAALWKRSRGPAVGLAIFVIAPLHTLGFVAFDFQRISTVADHYLYVAMLGIGLIAGWGVSLLPRRAAVGAVLIAGVSMSICSFAQTYVWRNSTTLLEHALQINPKSWAAENSLAVLDLQEGRAEKALERATRAIGLNPAEPQPYLVRGSVLAGRGDLPAATAEFRRAVDVAPNHAGALTNLGGILAQQRQFNDALVILQRAIVADPDNAQARLNLGTLQAQQGDYVPAASNLQAAVALSPTDTRARMNLGYVLLQLNRREEAMEQFQAVLAANPNHPAAREALQSLSLPVGGSTP